MADEGKKVSFGFSKSIKKSALKVVPPPEEKKVDYIECLDAKAIKVVGGEEKKDEVLVIPMLGSKTWHDRILNKTDADIFEPKVKKENGETTNITNGHSSVKKNAAELMDVSEIKKEVPEEAAKTLEEQAASEIIEDLKTQEEIRVEDPNLAVPMVEDESLRGTQQSTLEDYEQIPIDVFGLAMLRGMGWEPGKGLGKDEKLCAPGVPELRPRRMGLGADKALQKQNTQPRTKEEEELKLEKGTFVKIIMGKHVNNYGQVECFDDGGGRLMVKMALSGETLSLDECLVLPVTQAEFAKNSKVLNATKFEEYKNKKAVNGSAGTSDDETSDNRESRNRRAERSNKSSGNKKKSKKRSKYSSDESDDTARVSRKRKETSSDSEDEYKHKKSKKSKKHSKYSSDESSDSATRTSRKRRDVSGDSDDEYNRPKKSKKTKKSHKRDSSAERSSKKSKKRDKERERTRDRKSEYSESLDRRKHKKHKRSRSRSHSRR